MDDDGFTPPSRDRFREERRSNRRAERRRKLFALPIVVAGITLVVAGVLVFMEGDGSSDVPPDSDVLGTSIVNETTAPTTSSTMPQPTLPDEGTTEGN